MAAKKKRSKVVVVFNEEARKDFLLGFRRRKNERRRKAKEELEKKNKDKRKQLKAEKRKILQEQVEKQRHELEALESDVEDEDDTSADVDTTYEYPEHVVTVTTICDINLDSKSTCIGPNKITEPAEKESKHKNVSGSDQPSEACEQQRSNKGTLRKRKMATKWRKQSSSNMKGTWKGKRKKGHQKSQHSFKRKKTF